MVGFDPYAQFELSTFDYGAAGVMSGVLTRAVIQPLDVVKIRFQLQVDPIRRQRGKYHGMVQAVRVITSEEGTRALWKGHVPAQALSVVFGVVQFVSFEVLTKSAHHHLADAAAWSPLVNFGCGAASGCLAMTAALPLDVLRTRLVAQGEPKTYANMAEAVKLMHSQEGVRSFYRGFIPTVVQVAPYTGLQFALYTGAVQMWNSLIRQAEPKTELNIGALESLVCGSVAGTGAKIAVYPLDMLKKRLQVRGFEQARAAFGTVKTYRGLIHCISSIYRHEGYRGLFKGLTPSIVKAAVASGFGFLFFEQSCRLLTFYHKSLS